MGDLDSLVKAIYDGYYRAAPRELECVRGLAYFRQWSNELAAFDYSDLLLHQMAKDDHRYALAFILSTPFLWQQLGAGFWVNFLGVPVRPDTRRMLDQSGAFADIEFLSRFVGVDALTYLWLAKETTESVRRSLSIYFRKFSFGLIEDALDHEDLDGVYYVSKDVLSALRNDLCRNFGFQPIAFSDENVLEYVTALTLSSGD